MFKINCILHVLLASCYKSMVNRGIKCCDQEICGFYPVIYLGMLRRIPSRYNIKIMQNYILLPGFGLFRMVFNSIKATDVLNMWYIHDSDLTCLRFPLHFSKNFTNIIRLHKSLSLSLLSHLLRKPSASFLSLPAS